jgi:hypothetical protein
MLFNHNEKENKSFKKTKEFINDLADARSPSRKTSDEQIGLGVPNSEINTCLTSSEVMRNKVTFHGLKKAIAGRTESP